MTPEEISGLRICSFVKRLQKIGIKVELTGNFPWIYLDKVNGKRVIEKFEGNHGFTIAFAPIKRGRILQFTDIREIFNILRKYVKHEC